MRDGPAPKRMLTFASGGWVLLLTFLVSVGIVAWIMIPIIGRQRTRPPGDGVDPASFGFDLSTCLISRDALVAGQLHRDVLQSLVEPATLTATALEAYDRQHRVTYLVPSDRVIGVSIGGEARAYPLKILNLHEVANDTLGERPIAVTYNPLCDSVLVFDRMAVDPRSGQSTGQVLEFGVSGLLYNSNLVMFDRQPGAVGESLWSQLQARAIAGPAAATGQTLRVLPAELTSWGAWLDRHPDTTVLEPDPTLGKRYDETSYDGYFQEDRLLFPVYPEPPRKGPPPKTRCVIVLSDPVRERIAPRRLYTLPYLARRVGADGTWSDFLEDEPLTFHYTEDPESVRVTLGAEGEPAPVVYALWFSWYAMDRGVEVAE